jgi:uncharacterized protein YjiS (DUF1127 family)
MTFFRIRPLPRPARPAGGAAALLSWLRHAWQAHRTAAALAMLDDHLLSDIGFVRLPEAPPARPMA